MKTTNTAIITSAKNAVGTASVEFVSGVLTGLVVRITEPDRKAGESIHKGRTTEAVVLISREDILAVIGEAPAPVKVARKGTSTKRRASAASPPRRRGR